jgi:hypothetical protein
MAHTHAAPLVHGGASARSAAGPDDVTAERRMLRARANLGLAAIWAGLAVAIAVYAIDKESVGAGALAVFVLSQLLVPWRAAFRSDDEQHPPRPMAFG